MEESMLRLASCVTLAALAFAIACEGGGGASRPAAPRPAGTPAEIATAAASSSAPVVAASGKSDLGWTWVGADPSIGRDHYRGPIAIDTAKGVCRFRYEDKTHTRHVECFDADARARRWGYDEAGAFVEDAALVSDEDKLYVALFSNISSGCEVWALDLTTGEEAWRTRLVGLGAIAHSEYSNEVQISLVKDHVKLLGAEAAGRYVELVDRATGATVSTVRLDRLGQTTLVEPARRLPRAVPPPLGAAATVSWRWDDVEPMKKKLDVSIAAPQKGRCSWSVDDEERGHLECADASKKRLWGVDLAGQGSRGVALAVDEQRLYVARFHRIASGAVVRAHDARTGALVWAQTVFGLGPVDHSQYRTEVLLRVADQRLTVFGWESGGKYVEVYDARSGEVLGNRPEL